MEVKSESMRYENDEPKESIKEDKLNVGQEVNKTIELIKSLFETKESRGGSYSIAILGQWGKGKTTFINFVQEKLKDIIPSKNNKSEIEIKYFNPWFFSSTDHELKRHFIALISNKKNLLYPFILTLVLYIIILLLITYYSENIGIFFLNYPKVYLSLSLLKETAIPTFFFFILYCFIDHRDSFQKVTTLIKIAWSICKGDLYNILDGEDAYDSIKAQAQLKELTRDKKLLIIIDDIDRLHEHEIKKLFDLLKTIGNLPNIIYLLSFDYRVVSQALNKDNVKQGSKYLEKFIQYQVTLLPTHEELLTNEIREIFKISSDQFYSLKYYLPLLSKYLTTMRELKQLVRTLKQNAGLDYNNINPVHLLYITAIGLQQHTIYTLIWNSKETLCGKKILISDQKDLRNEFMSELEKFNPSQTCRNMIYELFPIIQEQATQVGLNEADKLFSLSNKNARIKHINNHNYFDIYFRLSFPDDLVCDEEFKSMLHVQDDRDTLYHKLVNLLDLGTEEEKQKITNRLANPFKWLHDLSSRLLQNIDDNNRGQTQDLLILPNWLLALAKIVECLVAKSMYQHRQENDFFNDFNNLFYHLGSDSDVVSLENSDPKPPIYAFLRIYLKIMDSLMLGDNLETKKQKLKNIVVKNIEEYSKNEKVFELSYWQDIILLASNDFVEAKSVVDIITTEINQDHYALLELIRCSVNNNHAISTKLTKYISFAEAKTKLEAIRLIPEFLKEDDEISSYIKLLSEE